MFRRRIVLLAHFISRVELQPHCVLLLALVAVGRCLRQHALGDNSLFDDLTEHQPAAVLAERAHLLVCDARQHWQAHHGRLDVLRCRHDNLTQTRDTKCHVRGTVSSKVERVESHLCRWLTNALCGEQADIFARLDKAAMVQHLGHRFESLST